MNRNVEPRLYDQLQKCLSRLPAFPATELPDILGYPDTWVFLDGRTGLYGKDSQRQAWRRSRLQLVPCNTKRPVLTAQIFVAAYPRHYVRRLMSSAVPQAPQSFAEFRFGKAIENQVGRVAGVASVEAAVRWRVRV